MRPNVDDPSTDESRPGFMVFLGAGILFMVQFVINFGIPALVTWAIAPQGWAKTIVVYCFLLFLFENALEKKH